MGPFEYVRAGDVAAAVALVSADPRAQYLAGGTTQIDLMLKDGVIAPERLVDITRLPLSGVTRREDTLCVGTLTTMEALRGGTTSSCAPAGDRRSATTTRPGPRSRSSRST